MRIRGKRRRQLLNDLMNKEDTGIWKRKHYTALLEELTLEVVTDL